jgi:hypothetical protein
LKNKRKRRNKLPLGGEFKVIPNLLLIGNLRHFIWQFLRSHEGTLDSGHVLGRMALKAVNWSYFERGKTAL